MLSLQSRLLIVSCVAGCLLPVVGVATARQEKSVRPGVNEPFHDPDVEGFVKKFESDDREIFAKRREIVETCQIKPGSVVVDIGAGTGLFTRLLSPLVGRDGRVYAVEIAPKFIDHIETTCQEQQLRNVVGVLCSEDSVSLPANSIDLAFICDTYHHFEFPDRTMRSIHRALRPGGQVILVEFHRIEGVSSEWVMNHVRAGQETFAHEIASAGFRAVEERKILKESYFLRFQKVDGPATSDPVERPDVPRTKKLIEWGWDEPDTAFIRQHVAEMEKLPFDGLVFHATGRKGANLAWELWGRRTFEAEEFQAAVADLQATEFRRFTDRFLRVNVTPGDVDWFDDAAWSVVQHNFGVAARVAKQGRCRGFMFDVEQYQSALFDYRRQKDRDARSFADFQAKVRERGRQWMQAVNAEFPDITVLLTFGYSITRPAGNAKSREESRYGLLADFLDGMFDACSPQTTIVDAWESSYPYKRRQQFEQARDTITNQAREWTSAPDKYTARVKAGFGIWMDHDWRRAGWDLQEFANNHLTPAEFENSLRHAINTSDEFV